MFENVERAAMLPLPAEPFDMSQWSHAQVNIDYRIAFDANFYSVRYHLVQERIEVRFTPTTVEIFHKGQRVASHPRCRGREQAITQNEHRPKSHQTHLGWAPSRMVLWAEQIGPHTARLIERILSEKPLQGMGRALESNACRFQSVKSILKHSLDQQPFTQLPSLPLLLPHDN